MKRTFAGSAIAAVFASLLSVGLLPGAQASEENGIQPVLIPPAGQTAVKGSDRVTFGGTVPAGASKSQAVLRVYDAAGDLEQELNVTPQTAFTADDRIEGSYKLPALDADGTTMRYEVEVARSDGTTDWGESNAVTVDLVPPEIERYELIGPQQVRVVFSEPVAVELDNPLDWRLESFPEDVVLSVDGAGERRVLNLKPFGKQGEDSTPTVTYIPRTSAVTDVYHDGAAQTLGPANRPSATALDRIPPTRIPEIDTIAGMAPGSAGADDTPDVVVGNILEGHTAEIYEETDGEPGRTEGDPLIGEAVAGASGAVVTPTAALDPDGGHVLHVAARDAAGNRTDGGSAVYLLDRVAPLAEYAALVDATHIEIAFTEALTPDGGTPAAWTVTGGLAVNDVSGTGDRRTLTLAAPASPGADIDVTYAPADGYTDPAGNALVAFGPLAAFNGIPPELDVTVPLATTWTAASTGSVHGLSSGAEQVEVYADQGNDGSPDGDPVAVLDAGAGSFAADLPLEADAANDFLVRGIRDEEGHLIEGPLRDVPTIVQDSTPPDLTLQAPSSGGPYAGGGTLEVRWSAADANFGAGPIRIERNLGSGWQTIAGAEVNDGTYEWTLPSVDTKSARVRVTATDRAGLATSRTSSAFEIDATTPRFDAITVDAKHIRVQFTEPVSGETAADEWRIDRDGPEGEPSIVATGIQREAGAITRLTLDTFPKLDVRANDTPTVQYDPASLPTRTVFRDAAGNRIEPGARAVVARDGIVPLAPDPDALDSPVDRSSIPVTGTAEAGVDGAGNQAIVRRIRPGTAAAAAAVGEDGSLSVLAKLAKNAPNVFKVSIQDPSGNVSPTSRVKTVEDSIRPRVTVRGPATRVRADRRNTIRWRTIERHRDVVKIRYQYRLGVQRRTRLIALATPDDGRFRWKAPGFLRGKQVRFRIIATDQAGHRGGAWGRWVSGL